MIYVFSRVCAAIVLMLIASTTHADVRVIDGDTFEMDGQVYRIEGIDAPEFGQRCNGFSGAWLCGDAATEALRLDLQSGPIDCITHGTDGYGRRIATCTTPNGDLGANLVARGLAWAFIKYSDSYVPQERRAKTKGIGIWQAQTEPAWEFRERRWASASQQAPYGCPIKGNISQNGRIYHTPWSPWYSRTRINLAKGERWFCSEAEALAAGWRAPRG